jgi:hypothetical protein
MGLSFAALGAGVFLPVSGSSAVVGDVKAMLRFPDVGAAFQVELGYALGL